MINLALSFDDVLLIPCKSSVLPRETDLETRLTVRLKLAMPIISSPMDTVTETTMAVALGRAGGIGIIHKNLSIDEQVASVCAVKAQKLMVGAAISVGEPAWERALKLATARPDVIVIDTAHGHSAGVIKLLKQLKSDARFKKIDIIAGNIATAEAAYDLVMAGVDAIKVGIGPGSICTTRIVTGVGVPQLTAITQAVVGRNKARRRVPIIADGGIKNSGDLAKALAAGAETVMLGGLLAGTDESPGDVRTINGQKFKIYRGMGSLDAMRQGSKDRYGQAAVANTKLVPEGVSGTVRYLGPVALILEQLTGGLQSSFGYLGAKNIKQFHQAARFIRITGAGIAESHPHSLASVN